ncbi:hypothetical protein EG328_011185 [Venturia inaequalis]|uniref:Uncharacterized protein n=2 Tax=Venturia inaequalis TaxID=5025 RepID=A0A8H3Z9E4_VENIN|nr:hypothetical protein EG328_011185 [Venturia inaequalis]KAE9990504.1 hypothetical protein EG327_001352 [Venturia inaequalis]
MKSAILFALPLAVSAAVIGSQAGNAVAPVAGIDKLTPVLKKNAQRTLTKFGPYKLDAASTGGKGGGGMGGMDNTLGGQTFSLSINKGFCNDAGPCTVYTGKLGVMFEDGTAATPEKGIYIHHVLTTDVNKKTAPFLSACNAPTRPGFSVSSLKPGSTGFVGVGEDSGDHPVLYTSEDGTVDAGYHIKPGERFEANVVLVNYNKEPRNVLVTYDLEWSPGLVGANTKGMLIAVNQCLGTRIKTSTTGPATTKSGDFTFLEGGKLFGERGHLHDGGEEMELFINGRKACVSKATYGTSISGSEIKTINSMSMCTDPIEVKKGDTLSMGVVYDLKKYPLRKSASGQEAHGVMGMWSLTFAPSSS